MTAPLRQKGGLAVTATVSLAAPSLGQFVAVPFAAIALVGAATEYDGQLGPSPIHNQDGPLKQVLDGVTGFALAATVLGLLTTSAFGTYTMPATVFAAAVCVPAFGALGRELVERTTHRELLLTGAYVAAGGIAGLVAQAIVAWQLGQTGIGTEPAFLAASGALVAAAIHSEQHVHDDPPVLLTVGFLLWVLGAVGIPQTNFVGAIVVVGTLAYVSYRFRTATVSGMLIGAFVALIAIVLGGIAWFGALVAFFGIGGLSTQFRYEQKEERGIAEGDVGARAGANVVCNAGVALVAVVGFAGAGLITSILPAGASDTTIRIGFALIYLGSLATALADTLASEIGGSFDRPRLITTLEPVAPGTDGGVTWQGELAGILGAVVIGIVGIAFPVLNAPMFVLAVVAGGVIGMTVDSLLGATVEGNRLGNGSVNVLATSAGGLTTAALGLLVAGVVA